MKAQPFTDSGYQFCSLPEKLITLRSGLDDLYGLERFRPDCTRQGRGDLLAEQGVVTRHGGAMARRRNAVPRAKRPASAVQSGRKRSRVGTAGSDKKGDKEIKT